MEENPNGRPSACLQCGSGALHCVFFCEPCSPGSLPYTAEQDVMRKAWLAGARDFPRSPRIPRGDATKPAKGQRWKAVANGNVFTLESRWQTDRGWYGRESGGLAALNDNDFTDGALTFVDHGEPASAASTASERKDSGPAEGNAEETTRPRAPAKASANPRGGSKKGAESSSRNHEATSGEHARAGYGTPAPLTAFQVIQARELDALYRRREAARAVASFVDDFDLLPDASTPMRTR